MPNFQLFIPGSAQAGSSIAAEDFAAAADELLAQKLESDGVTDDLGAQATAAVDAAKQLVHSGHLGAERVSCVISSRINPDAVPAGTGHIVSIELSSRPSDPAEVAATEAALQESAAPIQGVEPAPETLQAGQTPPPSSIEKPAKSDEGKAPDQPAS